MINLIFQQTLILSPDESYVAVVRNHQLNTGVAQVHHNQLNTLQPKLFGSEQLPISPKSGSQI